MAEEQSEKEKEKERKAAAARLEETLKALELEKKAEAEAEAEAKAEAKETAESAKFGESEFEESMGGVDEFEEFGEGVGEGVGEVGEFIFHERARRKAPLPGSETEFGAEALPVEPAELEELLAGIQPREKEKKEEVGYAAAYEKERFYEAMKEKEELVPEVKAREFFIDKEKITELEAGMMPELRRVEMPRVELASPEAARQEQIKYFEERRPAWEREEPFAREKRKDIRKYEKEI